MDCKKSRRGRPKGSGIDDSRLLREIAAMLSEDPELRPTTAIRNMGISDPSTIRRLRDKFKRRKETLIPEMISHDRIEKQRGPTNNADRSIGAVMPELRTMALNHRREPARTGPFVDRSEGKPSNKNSSDKDDSPRPGPRQASQNEPLRRVLADSLRTSSVVWQFQMLFATEAFKSPVYRSALRYHLAFSQTLLGFGALPPYTST